MYLWHRLLADLGFTEDRQSQVLSLPRPHIQCSCWRQTSVVTVYAQALRDTASSVVHAASAAKRAERHRRL